MNAKVENQNARFNLPKWIVVIALLMAGIVANDYFASQPAALRLVGWLLLVVVAVLVAAQTDQGRRAWDFLRDARTELRKVVWPTRQETLQTTLMVVFMVVITGLFLWGLDSVLLWLASLLAGHKG